LGVQQGVPVLISELVPSDARTVALDASCIETMSAPVYSSE
jgi:hypothetical protein